MMRSNSHYGTNGTNGTDGGCSYAAWNTLKGGHRTSQTSQNENCWMMRVKFLAALDKHVRSPVTRASNVGRM